MLWYALTALFVGGTILSNMVEGRSGIASTVTTAAITVDEWVVPVRSLSGLAPPSGGASYVEMAEPDTVDVGGTEVMTYTAVIFRNGDSYWSCRTAAGTELRAPCLFVARKDPVEHAAGEYVQSSAAAALQGAVSFSIGSIDGPLGLLAYPIQQGLKIAEWVYRVIGWHYSFLEGPAWYFKAMVLWPLSAATGYALYKITIEIVSTVKGLLGR